MLNSPTTIQRNNRHISALTTKEKEIEEVEEEEEEEEEVVLAELVACMTNNEYRHIFITCSVSDDQTRGALFFMSGMNNNDDLP